MSTVPVSIALQRIARLIPVDTRSTGRLTGQAVWVLTPPAELPEALGADRDAFRTAQSVRRLSYFHTGSRVTPDEALRYIVTSYGVPIAWVTLDGRTHFATESALWQPVGGRREYEARFRTMRRHRDAIRAAWPERFVLDGMGDPMYRRTENGTYVLQSATA